MDVAIAWSFKDLRKKISGVSSNVEFIDEILDNAWDTVGIELLLGVLKERIEQNDLSVYVISHRHETEKHITGETILVEKENGITRRVFA